MVEVHDKADGVKTGEQAGSREPRAQWQRPSVRKLQADDAELGPHTGGTDGTFTILERERRPRSRRRRPPLNHQRALRSERPFPFRRRVRAAGQSGARRR